MQPNKVIQMKQPEVPKPEAPAMTAPAALPAPKKKKNIAPGTHWTPKHDKIVIEGCDAGLSYDEIAQLIQDERPGATGASIACRISDLRKRYKAIGPARGPGGRPTHVPAATPPPAPMPAPLATMLPSALMPEPAPAPVVKAQLAKVTFEIGGKVRVVEVDEGTARQMLASALEL